MGFDIGQVVNTGRRWVGDAVDKVDDVKNQVGSAIDGAVHQGEEKLDQFRHGMVDFSEQHGGAVGGALARMASDQLGQTEGALLAAYDMGKGVVQLADGVSKLTNPIEWAVHGDRNLKRLETAAAAGTALSNLGNPAVWVTNPQANLTTGKALWDGVTQGYQDAARDGDYSKFAGRLVVDVGSMFIGVGEANAGIKGAQGAGAVAKLGEGTSVVAKAGEGASTVAKLGEGAGAVAKTGEAATGAKAADGVADAGKVADGAASAKAAEGAATAKGVASGPLRHADGTLNLDNAAARYAEVIGTNKPWKWREEFPGKFTNAERAQIKAEAVKQGLIPEVPMKPNTPFADFEKAGVVQKVDHLPEELWLGTDRAQFEWLDARIPGGRPAGTTWHHTEIDGRMELVPFGIHNATNHKGGRSPGMWADAPR